MGRMVVFYARLASRLVPMGVFSGSVGPLVTTNRLALVLIVASPVIVLGRWQLSGMPFPGFSRVGAGDVDPVNRLGVHPGLGVRGGRRLRRTGPRLGPDGRRDRRERGLRGRRARAPPVRHDRSDLRPALLWNAWER